MRDQVKEIMSKPELPPTVGGNLTLYVWEEILCNYGCGIAFALAKNVHQARELLRKKMHADLYPEELHEDLKKDPRIISEPEGFYVAGGD